MRSNFGGFGGFHYCIAMKIEIGQVGDGGFNWSTLQGFPPSFSVIFTLFPIISGLLLNSTIVVNVYGRMNRRKWKSKRLWIK